MGGPQKKLRTEKSKTLAFTVEGDKFRNYASAWRDRWNSMMELFMAGGNYPPFGCALPAGLPGGGRGGDRGGEVKRLSFSEVGFSRDPGK